MRRCSIDILSFLQFRFVVQYTKCGEGLLHKKKKRKHARVRRSFSCWKVLILIYLTSLQVLVFDTIQPYLSEKKFISSSSVSIPSVYDLNIR